MWMSLQPATQQPNTILMGAVPPAGTPAGRRPRRSKLRFVLDTLLGATLMVLLHLFVVQVSIVKGSSMEPCLHDGDRLVVDRVTYNVGDIHCGDVVVLRYPRNPALDFVKRVVGAPGNVLAMHAGVLFVDGQPADSYGCIHDHQDMEPITVPPGHFFVLGDNRPISCDSRDFGLVPQELIRGRVRVRIWPLDAATIF